MRIAALVWCGVCLCGWGIADRSVWADEKPAAPAAELDHEKLEAMWLEAAKPGPMHEVLMGMVGEWDAVIKDYMMKPGEVVEAKGESTFKSILGGRFIQHNYKAELASGPFEGLGISGYDNVQKKFVGVWMDTMGTGMLPTKGTYHEETKSIREQGNYFSPTGKMRFRMRTTKVNDDKYRMVMFIKVTEDAEEMKSMEIIYTRKP